MKIAIIAADGREVLRRYNEDFLSFGSAPDALLDGFGRLEGVEVHLISAVRRPVKSPLKLNANVWLHPILVPDWGMGRSLYLGSALRIRKFLQELQPDIVHGQGTERDCALAAILSGFPNVITVHGNMRLITTMFPRRIFSPAWFSAKLEGWTLPRSNGVVCITNYTRTAVQDLAKKTWLLPNAVNWIFHGIPRAASSPPRILCVGSVDARKNQNALIDALAPLAAERALEIHFYGVASRESEYGSAFFARVERHPWCIYAGMMEHKDLIHRFKEATLLVLPTREDNCPMVVLEAMAAGVPVIASKVGGVPDLVTDGQTGLLTNPDEPETMRLAVEKLLTDPDYAAALAGRAMHEAETRFHPRVIAESHLKIYREVLGQS